MENPLNVLLDGLWKSIFRTAESDEALINRHANQIGRSKIRKNLRPGDEVFVEAFYT